jgi:LacI family transcriptional regulator
LVKTNPPPKTGRRNSNVVTIHDVAKHAGVSPMTVSRVVNGESNVRETTRARVAESIEALRYSPNLAARSLASADTVRIALLYSNPSAAYLSELLVGSLEQSSQSGCQLLIERCDDVQSDREIIERLTRAGADGLILSPPLCESLTALQALEATGIPAVVVASGVPAPTVSAVGIHDFEAARDMTRHLTGLGHRDIGFIKGHPEHTSSGERYRGFLAAMEEVGVTVPERRIAQGYFTYRSGIQAAEELLTGEDRPTAVFASNDDMAAATVSVAHRLGLDVPGDVTVVGFGDTTLATTAWPELTTVRQPIADMARAAVILLLEQIRRRRAGGEAEVTQKLLDYTLMDRESSGPPA